MIDFEQARQNMLDGQLRPNQVTAAAVLSAFGTIPREKFVAKNMQNFSYLDETLPALPANSDTGQRFLLTPMVGARLLQALDIMPHELVLIVACGSGYEVALAAQMADMVIGLEDNDDMIAASTMQLAELDIGNAEITAGTLTGGVQAEAPFDAILLCGGAEDIGDSLKNQLCNGGRLAYVCTDGNNPMGEAQLIVRKGENFATRYLFDAYAKPLKAFAKVKGFQL